MGQDGVGAPVGRLAVGECAGNMAGLSCAQAGSFGPWWCWAGKAASTPRRQAVASGHVLDGRVGRDGAVSTVLGRVSGPGGGSSAVIAFADEVVASVEQDLGLYHVGRCSWAGSVGMLGFSSGRLNAKGRHCGGPCSRFLSGGVLSARLRCGVPFIVWAGRVSLLLSLIPLRGYRSHRLLVQQESEYLANARC